MARCVSEKLLGQLFISATNIPAAMVGLAERMSSLSCKPSA